MEALIKRINMKKCVSDYPTTQRHISDDVNEYIHCCGTSRFSHHVLIDRVKQFIIQSVESKKMCFRLNRTFEK
jgi:hypothetical protein